MKRDHVSMWVNFQNTYFGKVNDTPKNRVMGKESNEREREGFYNELFFERKTGNSLKRSHIGMN